MNLKNSVERKETDQQGYDCLGTVESSWLGKYLRELFWGDGNVLFFLMFYVLNGVLLKCVHLLQFIDLYICYILLYVSYT